MKTIQILALFVELVGLASTRLETLKTVDDYMNICLDGRNHKSTPGPEEGLVKQFCSPWANRSCCTKATAEGMRINKRWLNFDWDHCSQLSPRCREQFLMDLCFYECSPNVGPWLVQDVRKIRKERFMYVPLCKTVCDNWWEACRDDFTCVENWAAQFNWSAGINTCPTGTACRPFHQVYTEASHFCESLMGHSFKVMPDEEDCFYLWFDPQYPNPNLEVAKRKASSLVGVPYSTSKGEKNDHSGCSWNYPLFSTSLLTFVLVFETLCIDEKLKYL